MNYPIDYNRITVKTDFYQELIKAHEEASLYLLAFAWCRKIVHSDVYLNLGSTLCIFVFQIENSASTDDNNLWVIVGDIPPMYLDTYGPQTTKHVLEDYIRLAEDWIDHVKDGKSINNCYPFKAEPTIEMATLLEKRVSFMKNTLIDNIAYIPLQTNL
ncbi:hypothetical protein SNE25_24345 [Mucilaginibacter sabulilitoris]|uniref:DUF3841 domain-containing protein n=1 Tax=Mucilaginibacter sabulilitoris TaxID=1173583 RepID=A0ABZ0TH18_9SPHI|nr:hypothetical protein [Mucilaginibacter sabulilitoris]WPU92462.1 hypothetical protein SNE25_24345 [Mucilaginibacter sabulilitoris]